MLPVEACMRLAEALVDHTTVAVVVVVAQDRALSIAVVVAVVAVECGSTLA